MASYSIVSNARFRPFSYDELVKPLVQYKEAYDKAEADYTNLAMQTEAWRDIANQENSPIAYKMYKTYSDDLSKMVDDFSKGMTLSNRSALMGLKRRYASEITPIARASEALNKAEAFRAETLARNPNAVFEVDNYNSIDDFLGGKRANNTYWDGDAAMKRVAAKAEALGRSLYSNPTAKLFLNGQQYQISQLNGISPNELTQILLSPENINTEAGKQMRRIIDDELGSIDMSRYSSEGQSRINNIIATGMYAGLAKPTYNYVANGEYMSRAERDASSARWATINMERERQEEARKKASGEIPIAVDPDGTRHFTNGINAWTETPTKYIYKDPDTGKEYTGTTPYGYKLENGKVLKDWTLPSNPSYKRSDLIPINESSGSTKSRTSESPQNESTKRIEAAAANGFTESTFTISDKIEPSDEFNLTESAPISVYNLSGEELGTLTKYLKNLGLTIEDVNLIKDEDNNFKMTLKNNSGTTNRDANAASLGGM